MKAGFSSKIITPNLDNREKPLSLGGFLPRKYCSGIHDDLYIRAVYIEGKEDDPTTRILMMVGDVISIDKNFALLIKRKISKRIPIPEKNILISATHTHHGPDFKGVFKVGGPLASIKGFLFPRPQTKDLILFGKRIIECAINAYNNCANATISFAQDYISEDERVMINRRDIFNNKKAIYPVSVAKIFFAEGEKKGKLMGAFLNYAIHGTVLPRYNTLITADYVGYIIKYLESNYPDCKGNFVYFNGPCGEINPLTSELAKKMNFAKGDIKNLTNDDIYDQIGTWEDAERIGKIIGKVVEHLIESESPTNDNSSGVENIQIYDNSIKIPLLEYNYGSNLPLTAKRIGFKLKKKFFLLLAKMGILKSSVLISTDTLSKGYLEAYIQIIQIGSQVIYSVPAEFFLELANEIINFSKELNSENKYFMIELANNSIGYVYTIEAYLSGGYESEFSLTPLVGRFLTMKYKKFIASKIAKSK